MSLRLLLLGTALIGATVPAVAQQTPTDPNAPTKPLAEDPGYDRNTPRDQAIDNASRPGVVAANQEAGAQAQAQVAAQAQMTAAQQAQYDTDIADYAAALRAHHRAVVATDATYLHQRRAYADAMFAWRMQVDACKHGHNAACRAPTPDPASFW